MYIAYCSARIKIMKIRINDHEVWSNLGIVTNFYATMFRYDVCIILDPYDISNNYFRHGVTHLYVYVTTQL